MKIKKDLFIQLVKALNFVHKHEVIHRDIKPENILVDENYLLKLTDFGLAQESMDKFVTQQYAIVGTPAYMSPEQIQGEKLTVKSDLFSLGIVAAELFTGTNPFLGEDTNETINKIISFDEEKFNEISGKLDEPFQKILRSLLAVDVENRFDSAEDILKILNVTESEVINSSPKKNSKKFAFIISLIIIAIAIGVYFLFNINQNPIKTASTNKVKTDSIGYKEDLNSSEKNENLLPSSNEVVNNENQKNKPTPVNEVENSKGVSFGELYIKCYPWAKIFINNQFIETTPLQKNINLEEGTHLLTLVHPDYPKYSDSIKILPDKLNFVEINLDTLFGYLECQVYPWGELFVDGESRGITPFEEPIRLSEGKYRLELKNPKYGSIKNVINIKKKDTLKLRFNMLQKSEN
jgi:serine/threonine-protein kinase